MKKVRMFFVAAALVLVTAGVFAGKANFQSSNIYAYDAGTYFEVVSNATLVDLTTTNTGVQAKISDLNGHAYPIYLGKSTSTPLFTTVAF